MVKTKRGNLWPPAVVYSPEEFHFSYETIDTLKLRSTAMFKFLQKRKWPLISLVAIVLLAMLVAACAGGTGGGTSNGPAMPSAGSDQSAQSANSNGSTSSTSPSSSKSSAGTSQQYLIKSFNINMEVKDTRRVAADLQAWISATDPLALVTNASYQQVDNNLYSVTLTFSVQASLFPSIENYLNTYPAGHGGKLLNVAMNTQDVSGDYVDSQSRLTNLKAEQQRLLTLESHAQVLGDILAIDQQLTNVEGQIEQIEAHLTDLKGQTSFYNVTVNLQPAEVAVTPSSGNWSFSAIWQAALNAIKVVGQALLTVAVWLLVFSVYIVPLGVIIWLVRRWWRTRALKSTRAATP
jgi:hypothetical protein